MQQDTSSPQGFRILVIVSRPLDLPDLPNLADQWALQNGLQRVQAPAFLKMLRPPTVEGLRSEILGGYDIVHFDGHGALGRRCRSCGALHLPQEKKCDRCTALLEDEEVKGYFAFEREDGKLDALAAEELAEIVTSAPEPVKLVFLSACESAKGGDASLQNVLLAKGVPAVLGMNESVPLKATMALAGPFYAGLVAGMTIIRAFENALPALKKLENGGEWQKIPVLEGPGKDARILPAKVAGRASFEAERLFGLPEHEFVGDYNRGDPPRGRKGLLSQVMDAHLDGEKLIVLTGQGGIGKTVLAAEAASRLAWRYLGGVFWRSAAEMEHLGLEEMLNAFDNVLGPQIRTLPLDAKRDQVLGYLRNYDTASLLVVDNAESIKDTGLWRFLEGIPQPSAALLTTRESLPCGGREIRVPEMENEEAIRLFFREARKSFPKWGEHLNAEEQSSLAEIAGFMQGHPLAIKLVAGQSTKRSLAGIRDELRRNPPKKVSERFDVSSNSLEDGQKDLFSRLAVFFGSMDDSAIRSVCLEDGQQGQLNWESDLEELVRSSFLDRAEIAALDNDGNEVTLYRYRLHPLMRQYADGKAGEELLVKLRPRAAKYFLEYARHFSSNFDMLEWERDNILAGMDWAVGLQNSSSGESKKAASSLVLEFMSVLLRYLDTRGYWSECQLRLHQAIEAAEMLEDRKNMAGWVHDLGILAQSTGEYDEAHRLYRQSMEIFRDLGDKSGLSSSLHEMGVLAQVTGEYDEARKLYQQSMEIAVELGDKSGVASLLHNLGMLAQATGEYDEARKLYRQSMEIFQNLGDKSGVASLLHNLGILAQAIGEYDEARRLYQQSMEIKQDLGDKKGVLNSMHQMGTLAQVTGEYDEARRLYEQSLKIAEDLSDKSGVSRSLHQLGMMAQATGEYDEARRLYRQSMEIAVDLGDKSGIASLLHQMGTLAQAIGDYDEARKLYRQSMKIKQDLGDKSSVSLSLHNLGMLAQVTGEYDEARRLYLQSMEIAVDLGDKSEVAGLLHNLGALAQATGDCDEARRLYLQSMKTKQELGDKSGIALSRAQLALLEEQMGNKREALQLIRLAEAAFLELGSPYAEQARKARERIERNQ
jgi:tetratricopeptide (TPR) repeat protein